MTSLLASAVNRLLGALGLELLPRWRLREREIATHLQALFDRYRVDCVLDVGANQGQYRDFLRRHVGYEGPIVSFEPVPAAVEVLERRAKADPRWQVVPVALGREGGEQALNVAVADTLSSFLAPDFAESDHAMVKRQVARRERVPVRRLDGMVDELGLRDLAKRFYLKLDTQGYDLEVVAGAGDFLKEIVGLQTEAAVLKLYSGMPDYCTAIATLRDLGFDVTGMFTVTRDEHFRLVEFDCVMLNRSLCR